MTKTLTCTILAVFAFATAGCGGTANTQGQESPQTATQAQRSTADPVVALRRSVNAALDGNYRLAVYVLWYNRVPTWGRRTTEGPALASLRSAAATRQTRGVRVRMLAHRRTILQLRLDPSYATASALIIDWQRVQPSNPNGRALGRAVILRERARYELRRIGGTRRFLVWKVVLLK